MFALIFYHLPSLTRRTPPKRRRTGLCQVRAILSSFKEEYPSPRGGGGSSIFMDFIFNNPKYKQRRKELRNSLGLPEIILWNQLKSSKLGVKFRRQYGVGLYVIDFYCYEKHLGIELDGETHNNNLAQQYDKIRTDFIEQHNIKIIRFQNLQILNNLNGVVEEIKKNLA